MYTSNDPKVIGRSYINQAIGAYNSGDNYGAQVYLARAIISDPDLKNDPEVRTLASKYTGLDVEAALKRLTTPAKKSRDDNNDTGERDKGGDQWFVVLLELIVLFVTGMFLMVFVLSLARQFPNEIMAQSGLGSSQEATRAEFSRILAITEPVRMLQIGLYAGAAIVVGVVVWNSLMYAFCLMALGGTGGIGSHMSAAFRVQIGALLVEGAAILVSVWAFRVPASQHNLFVQIANGLSLASSLGSVIALIYFMEKVHDFGFVKSFIAVVLSPIIIACGLCGLLSMTRMIR